MTEEEWLAASNPMPMLDFLRDKASGRKLGLFAVGCCRLVWSQMQDERSRAAVEAGEAFADDQLDADLLLSVAIEAHRAREDTTQPEIATAAAFCANRASWVTATSVNDCFQRLTAWDNRYGPEEVGSAARVRVLECIFGNPFRPVTVDPGWLTSTVVALAEQMYESRDFAPMPVLADALQDAGCEHPDILAHCRGAGPHVRGCWVVDLLLGKS